MDLFRSEPMQLAQLIIPVESAYLTVSYLGDLGLFQFNDLNTQKSPFQRTYAGQLKRCGEMLRKLNFFTEQMSKASLLPSTMSSTNDMNLDELEVRLGELEAELVEMNSNNEKLLYSYNELLEYMLVLQKADEYFHSAQNAATAHQREYEEYQLGEGTSDSHLLLEQVSSMDDSKQARLGFVCGLVPRNKSMALERILFRATRGNIFLQQLVLNHPVVDPASGEKVDKNVFLIFYSGHRTKDKIRKICEAFGANRYPVSDNLGNHAQMITEVSDRISELKSTIDAGFLHRDNALSMLGDRIEQWYYMVKKEKSIYHILNMLSLDVTKKCFVAEGWFPVFATKQIQDALELATCESNSQIGVIFQVLDTKESPPTYFRTNKFTSAFQEIIDAYGVAKYQEVNPCVYTIITFPFLFAVMFGDWGHGICLLLGTLYYIMKENKLTKQKLGDMEMIFGGRYIILMMAIFSIFTGLIYNEFFSVPLELFGSSAYACRELSCSDATTAGLVKVRGTYPFGVDPAWHGTRSELPFLNSLKMKMSIVLGVTQMNVGIILSYYNAKFSKNNLNIWYQFVPQMIFLNSLFGYLSVLIVMKWCTASRADLYHVMIYMFLSPTQDLGENQLFVGQKLLQIVLLLLAVVAVPWMLLPKPFLLKRQHQQRHRGQRYVRLDETEESEDILVVQESNGHEDFQFSEILVHQLIHTIEFVLGAVSNTASYLRLWALSLAHSELSSVFFDKVLLAAWRSNNLIILILGIFLFLNATIGVLLSMETLSAFLHALRLHWVEFQGKFYEGDGYKFTPFSFALLNDEEQ